MTGEPRNSAGPGRRSGRPTSSEGRDVRTRLLAAARELFARRGFDAVSTRELARAAGATPAMVHYYFGDKHGLFRALWFHGNWFGNSCRCWCWCGYGCLIDC